MVLSVAFVSFVQANFAKVILFIWLLMSSLCCIVANKGMHDFSGMKVFMLIFFLMEQYCFCLHRVTHIYVLWIHKNKVHGALFLCVILIFESYMWLWLVL